MSRLNRLKRKTNKNDRLDAIRHMRSVVATRQRMYITIFIIILLELVVMEERINIWVRLILQLAIVGFLATSFIKARKK